MKYPFLVFICIVCACQRTTKDPVVHELPHYLNHLTDTYHSRTLPGLYSVDSVFAKNYTSPEKCVDGLFGEKKDTLAEEYLETLGVTKREETLARLENWLKVDYLLGSVVDDHLTDDLSFNEIINNIPATKAILQEHIKGPGQYWGSIDGSESCVIYYEVIAYLMTLNEKDRLLFFKQYFDVACTLSLKK